MTIAESWDLECETFDGVWILNECEAGLADDIAAGCFALVLAVRVVANAVRRGLRGEDLRDDVAEVRDYMDAIRLRSDQYYPLQRLLAALVPFNPERVSEELLAATWLARRDGLDRAARSLAELAYDSARLAPQSDAHAQCAAFALSRLALLDECPRAARKWRRFAHVHGRRAARRYIVGE